MLDHISISVPASRLEEITTFYLAALAPLGYQKWKDYPGQAAGLGPAKYNVPFWIGAVDDKNNKNVSGSASGSASGTGTGSASASGNALPMHLAFRGDKTQVEAFHEQAIKAGGKCNGKPGLRNMYHDKYYAAFVWDPLGNNVEVVDHGGSSIH